MLYNIYRGMSTHTIYMLYAHIAHLYMLNIYVLKFVEEQAGFNAYQTAIINVGEILEKYDHKQFPYTIYI